MTSDDAKYCSNGHPNRGDAKRCGECGQVVTDAEELQGFSLFSTRATEDSDGWLYPIIGADQAHPMALEQWDGDLVKVNVSSFSVHERKANQFFTVLKLPASAAEMYVTDSRVVVSASHWNKGKRQGLGFGTAAALSGLTRNAITLAKEAKQRQGQAFLGQVRYSWLSNIGFAPSPGGSQSLFGGKPCLRMCVNHRVPGAPNPRRLYLDVKISYSGDISTLAQSIVQRAAKYRLNFFPDVSETTANELRALENIAPLPLPQANSFSMYSLPDPLLVGSKTSYPNGLAP